MRNKRQISCQVFIKVLDRKRRASPLLQAVALMKRHQKLLQMAEEFSSATFLSLTSR